MTFDIIFWATAWIASVVIGAYVLYILDSPNGQLRRRNYMLHCSINECVKILTSVANEEISIKQLKSRQPELLEILALAERCTNHYAKENYK